VNTFQKQTVMGDGETLAEKAGQDRDGVGRNMPPVKVSVEEFERDRVEREECQAALYDSREFAVAWCHLEKGHDGCHRARIRGGSASWG
jgi:hypothetical protein